jgi:hypothetical protein
MAATFKYLPKLVPNIFAEIVAKASTNLSSDANFDISQISFKHGNWDDIKNELIKQGNSYDDVVKSTKYPLVCLIHAFNEGYVSANGEFTGDLLIVAPCKPDEHIPYKYSVDGNFQKYLNPIYAELVSLIKASSEFAGYTAKVEFPKRDLIHFNSTAENNQYMLPDLLDGVLIPNLTLRLAKPRCSSASKNNCVPTHTVSLISNIKEIKTDIGGNFANVTFSMQEDVEGATYTAECAGILIEDVQPNTIISFNIRPFIDTNRDTEVMITETIGDTMLAIVTLPIIINGNQVQSYGLTCGGLYSVNTDCGNYMALTMSAFASWSNPQIKNISITLDGVPIFGKTYTPALSDLVVHSDEFYSVPLLIPTDPNATFTEFIITTTYTSVTGFQITHTSFIQLQKI